MTKMRKLDFYHCCEDGCMKLVKKEGNRCRWCAQRLAWSKPRKPRGPKRSSNRPPWPRENPILDAIRAEVEGQEHLAKLKKR